METAGQIGHHPSPARGSPADFGRALGRSPVQAAVGNVWEHVALERYQVPSFELKLGAIDAHRVTLHLAGPVLIERTRDGAHDRRWSHAGCSNLIPSGVPVTRSFSGQADFTVAYIAPAIVDEVATEVFGLDPARVELLESFAVPDDKLQDFSALLLAEAEAGGPGTRLFADSLTRALALHLLRAYSPGASRMPVPMGPMVDCRLRRALECIHASLAEDLPLSRLAAAAGLSPSHFARSFRAAVGQSPHRYVIHLRVERARGLLEDTRMPVVEVGIRCGFAQITHFATMFRKVTGLSPRAYRASRRC